MYKSRFFLWIGIILTLVTGKFLYNTITTWDETHPHYYYYTDVPDAFSNAALNKYHSSDNFDITSNPQNADIIIKTHSDGQIDGYKKYDKLLYTPLVAFAYEADQLGFNKLSETNGVAYYKDLAVVLDAIENEKTFEDIGLTKFIAGPVKLTIPDKGSSYYLLTEELFYEVLNDGKIPTEEERANLKERVDNLLDKCEKSEDVRTTLVEIKKNNSISQKYPLDSLYIAPEFIAINEDTEVFRVNNSTNAGWYPVYFGSTVAQYFDLYVKEDNVDKLYQMFYGSDFSSKTGIRISNGSDGYYKSVYNIKRNVNIVN